ncbi:MAG: glycogen debranching protein GlgX [Candidatus Melainabacteria bacterium]|nr:glycogen debranching protein GlgX [Candidatus Melainabacteria bacterium]
MADQPLIYKAHRGLSYPLGASLSATGVNFAVYSKRAAYLELLLFDSEESPLPFAIYKLSAQNRSANYWHIFLEGASANLVYAWRAYGNIEAENQQLFDHEKVLLDPYSRAVVGWKNYCRKAASAPGDNCEVSLRALVLEENHYDWQGDQFPDIESDKRVIYELHVGGFTRNANSGVSAEKRGTFAGLIEKLPYLKELGITTIELMPVQVFDRDDAPSQGKKLENYWGYSPICFFAPHPHFSSAKSAQGIIDEFRDMVKACHASGIEVILDVVFNHTAENDDLGPTISLKGLDRLTYYIFDEALKNYKNYSGCGNTLRTEHPVVGRLLLDALRYWVEEMHVDGFRFDLASILSRDIFGVPLERPPLLWSIESDPVLAASLLIAEAWDPAGLYQVGWFVGQGSRFAEWNGPFRDDVRRFVKGDNNSVIPLVKRLTGSSDIYGERAGRSSQSINFITCHDGFTINDLVSYDQKHNQANGENNRDGRDDNYSWNCGYEGECKEAAVEELREKQIRNLLTILFLSSGTPMLSMGDEVRRTTSGNNNAYCQNNETNWLDWSLFSKHRSLFNFTRDLIKLTRHFNLFRQDTAHRIHMHSQNKTWEPSATILTCHGVNLNEPDFSPTSHSIAIEIQNRALQEHAYVVFNSYWSPLTFQLPATKGSERFHNIVDTSLSFVATIADFLNLPAVATNSVTIPERSIAVFMSSASLTAPHLLKANAAAVPSKSITWTGLKRPQLSDFD